MADLNGIESASEFLDRHPRLREAMAKSEKFTALKAKQRSLNIDGEELFFGLYGDVPVNEDELYLKSLLEGARQKDGSSLYGELFAELSNDLKSVIEARAKKA